MCSCCPCGFFTVQPRQTGSEDKYRLRDDQLLEDRSARLTIKQSTQLEGPAERFQRSFHAQADVDGEVDAYELREVLRDTFTGDLTFPFDGFSLETCRSMVALGDPDLSGQLRYQEAELLFGELWKWRTLFQRFDTDKIGYFHVHEFRDILQALGFDFNDKSVHALCTRYADKHGHVTFGDFVACMFKLTTMYEIFREKSNNQMDRAGFTADEFIQMTLYS